MIYLNSYHPLALYPSGRKAAQQYGIPLYADASCRREPDLEAALPAISALCRTTKFAPRLKVGDIVVYVTVSGCYPPIKERYHYRLTAVLEIIKQFDDHIKAASWYREHNQPIPSNCLVEDNPPIPLNKTVGFYYVKETSGAKEKVLGCKAGGASNIGENMVKLFPDDVAEWDDFYKERILICSVMLACKPLYVELHSPRDLDSTTARQVIFIDHGKMPGTNNPTTITPADFHRLMNFCGTGIRVDEELHAKQVTRRK